MDAFGGPKTWPDVAYALIPLLNMLAIGLVGYVSNRQGRRIETKVDTGLRQTNGTLSRLLDTKTVAKAPPAPRKSRAKRVIHP